MSDCTIFLSLSLTHTHTHVSIFHPGTLVFMHLVPWESLGRDVLGHLHINFAQSEDLCLFAQSPSFGDPCEFDGTHAFWGWVCAQMWPTGVYHPVATVTGSEVGMLTKKANSGSMLGPFL